ncbi:5-carboxymethyl-2-hydroxymuconate isomerase, partial [Burkholderia pseudomallei]
MPHIIVEYTANIRDDARIPVLLKSINETLIAQGGVFPTGGIRSRAIELQDYCVADGTAADAFVHVTLKIGAGRDDATKKAACDALFDAIKAH